jgi:sensor histidine kinase YesM
LNPHFINNALQWLQIRLDNKDDEEGVSVIAKLSENIRAVFSHSRAQTNVHSLRDELKLTENYLYVQKRRFRDKLQYELPDVACLHELMVFPIPLLMIQIHVENAVEHGIRNKKTPGTVSVRCVQEGDALMITIEDDGVGRNAAKKIGSMGTGNGVLMLQEVQSFYNTQNDQVISQTYTDDICIDEAGNRFGTRMTIRIPLNYTYA